MADRSAPPTITSRSNPRILEAVRLRERRERERTGRTLIDGAHELAVALRAGAAIDVVYAVADPALAALDALDLARSRGIPVVPVSPAVLERIAFGDRSDGLVAVARVPDLGLNRLAIPGDSLVAVIESVEKPGNLGAVLRTAEAVGAAVIAADPRTDVFNPNAIRASIGTIFTVPIAVASSAETIAWLRDRDFRIMAARVDGNQPYWEVDLRGRVVIALGSETHGLSEAWSGPDITAVRLPMAGIVDSLNVSTTAAVLLYEAMRQRASAGSSSPASPVSRA
jgi:TrmH family RNA methyltransferase